MKKMEAYYYLVRHSEDAGFVANLVLTRCKWPAQKLKRLVGWAKDGKTLRMASFSIDTLLIDGAPIKLWEL